MAQDTTSRRAHGTFLARWPRSPTRESAYFFISSRSPLRQEPPECLARPFGQILGEISHASDEISDLVVQ